VFGKWSLLQVKGNRPTPRAFHSCVVVEKARRHRFCCNSLAAGYSFELAVFVQYARRGLFECLLCF
jgi:hypothetical protein